MTRQRLSPLDGPLLVGLIHASFTEDELQVMCGALSVSFEDVPRRTLGKEILVRELVRLFDEAGRSADLISACAKERTDEPRWSDVHLIGEGEAICPAIGAEELVLVADFDDRSAGKLEGIDPAQYLYDQIREQARRDGLDIRFERLRTPLDDARARDVGDFYDATLVIGGWYDRLGVNPFVENVRRPQIERDTEKVVLAFDLLDRVTFDGIQDLRKDTSYLVLLTLGLEQFANARFHDALKFFGSAVNAQTSVNKKESHFYRGNTAYAGRAYDKALADFQACIGLGGDYAYNNCGNAHMRLGEPNAALVAYQQALDRNPDNASAWNNSGVARYFSHDLDAAVKDFSRAIESGSICPAPLNNRGNLLGLLNRHEQAIADFDAVLKVNPNHVPAYINRGAERNALGQYNLAVADFNKAIELDAERAEPYFNRATSYLHQDDLAAAFQDLNTAVQKDPNYADAYRKRGGLFDQAGMTEQALADYAKAIALTPADPEPVMDRALLYFNAQQFDAAIADCTRIIELNPASASAYYYRGGARAAKGDLAGAKDDLRACMAHSAAAEAELKQKAQNLLQVTGG